MPTPIGSTFPKLVDVMKTLLGPDGCPWDREQDLASLRPYLIEECFELVDAIDNDDRENHREELGDLLFQIVFQSALRERDGDFDVDAVILGITEKLRSRHPHVFGDSKADSAQEVLSRWEELKAAEKRAKGIVEHHLLDSVPHAMPALSRAQKISQKVARVGFDWPDAKGCLAKVKEETQEVEEAISDNDPEHMREEIGDLLFALVGLANKLGIDAESSLASANRKFAKRFAKVEDRLQQLGKTCVESDLDEMDQIWNEIKHQ